MDSKDIYKKLSAVLVIVGFTLLFLLYTTNKKCYKLEISYKQQIDSLDAITDTLREELFIEKTDNGRHEITREEIFYKYPKVGKEYQQFYEHETE